MNLSKYYLIIGLQQLRLISLTSYNYKSLIGRNLLININTLNGIYLSASIISIFSFFNTCLRTIFSRSNKLSNVSELTQNPYSLSKNYLFYLFASEI